MVYLFIGARLERYLVVHVAAAVEAGGGFGGAAAVGATAATATAALALGIEHGQLAAEVLEHDLGRVFLLAVLVGPFAGLERALDIDLGAFAQVLLGDLGEVLVEDDHAVPLGLLFPLAAGLVAPGLGRGDGKVHDGVAALHTADLRVRA